MQPRANHPESHNALGKGQRLGEFEILDIVGVGGFGIVYRAYDHTLLREVALKEYLPASLAGRNANQQVSVLSQSHAETFALGLRSFIGEARMLARFDHPGLLKVHRFWEGNGTAYMVMPILHGHTLRALRQAMTEAPDEAWLRHLLTGLLGPLDVLHQADVFHRDIAPDNIHIATDGAAILLDFGAARQVIAGRSQDLTAMLKPCYAPIEQYGEAPGLRQGAWTDLYALGATLHYLIAGAPPPPAPVRAMAQAGLGLSATARAGISAGFLDIVDWMLAPHPANRPQSVAQLRAALAGQCPVPKAVAAVPDSLPWPRTEVHPPSAAAPTGDDDATVLQPRSAAVSASALALAPAPTPASASALAAPASPAAVPAAARRLWPLAAAVLLAGAAVLAWVAQRVPAPASPPPAARALDTPAAAAAPAPGSTAATSAPAAPPAPEPAPALVAGTSSLPGASNPDARQRPPAASAARPLASRPVSSRPVPGTAASTALTASPSGQPAPAITQAAVSAPATAPPPAASPTTPVPTAPAASPSSPNEACGKRVFIALYQCLLRECARPEFQAHPSCVSLRRMEEQNRPRDSQ